MDRFGCRERRYNDVAVQETATSHGTNELRVSLWDGEPPRLQAKPSGGRRAGSPERSVYRGGSIVGTTSAANTDGARTTSRGRRVLSASADAARESLAFRRGRLKPRPGPLRPAARVPSDPRRRPAPRPGSSCRERSPRR